LLSSIYGWTRGKTLKSPLRALAIAVGYAKTIQMNLQVIEVAGPLASYAKIHGVTRSGFYFSHSQTVGYSPNEENRLSEKLPLTLKSRK
jgi:hypothetical protein